jgi:hypothetical protein
MDAFAETPLNLEVPPYKFMDETIFSWDRNLKVASFDY